MSALAHRGPRLPEELVRLINQLVFPGPSGLRPLLLHVGGAKKDEIHALPAQLLRVGTAVPGT